MSNSLNLRSAKERDILMALYFKYIANKKIYFCTAEPLAFGKSRVSEKKPEETGAK